MEGGWGWGDGISIQIRSGYFYIWVGIYCAVISVLITECVACRFISICLICAIFNLKLNGKKIVKIHLRADLQCGSKVGGTDGLLQVASRLLKAKLTRGRGLSHTEPQTVFAAVNYKKLAPAESDVYKVASRAWVLFIYSDFVFLFFWLS